MSWHFSQVLVAEYLERSSSGGELSAGLRSNPTPSAYLYSDRMKAFSRLSQFGMTFEVLTESRGEELLTWFLAGFPAKTSVPSERKNTRQGLTEARAGSGLSLLESLTKYDLPTRSWKTQTDSSQTDLTEFSDRWPKSGTMRNGVCWGPTIAVPPTKERESGLWHGTPRCADSVGASDGWSLKWQNPASHFRWFLHTISPQHNKSHRHIKGHSPNQPMTFPNPECMEVVMGWPVGWTALTPLETDKFQSWQQQHGISC